MLPLRLQSCTIFQIWYVPNHHSLLLVLNDPTPLHTRMGHAPGPLLVHMEWCNALGLLRSRVERSDSLFESYRACLFQEKDTVKNPRIRCQWPPSTMISPDKLRFLASGMAYASDDNRFAIPYGSQVFRSECLAFKFQGVQFRSNYVEGKEFSIQRHEKKRWWKPQAHLGNDFLAFASRYEHGKHEYPIPTHVQLFRTTALVLTMGMVIKRLQLLKD